MKTPAELPESIEELRALVHSQQDQLTQYSKELQDLQECIRLLRSLRYGRSSERSSSDQMGLFNEAEVLCAEPRDEAEDATIDIPAHQRKRGGRRPLPESLPREIIRHDLPDDQKFCDQGHALVEIGEDKLEQLVLVPASAKVEVHVRPKYACSSCKDGVKTQALPPQPIPKSIATPSLLAQIATAKYADALPLHRQEKIFRRIGVDLPRATMASWMIRMGELIDPLVRRMLEEIRSYDYVQADETPFQVLKEHGKRATSHSYLWALCGGDPTYPLLYYEYDPSRSGEVARRLLEGFKGYLQTDGYAGYDRLGLAPEIVHVGCFAHARRKFDEALRGQGGKKPKSGGRHSIARQGLERINKLYALERSGRDATLDERKAMRQEKMRPALDALRKWLDDSLGRVPPQSLAGKAVFYLDSQWPKLVRVLDDARIPLDTNRVERSIRPFVIGRRNWLFADTPRGATASAKIYSLVETAKINGLEPWAYLERVFATLPGATDKQVEELLPWKVAIRPVHETGLTVHI